MNQLNWTYLDDIGNRHLVGIAHGAESGNLLIYVNSEIVKIDFKVFKNKAYNFFIDEELCTINVEKGEKLFLYSFDIDKQIDTPLNRERKKIEKKYLYQSLASVAVLAVVVMASIFGMTWWNTQTSSNDIQQHLNRKGMETTAKVYINPKGQGQFVSHNFIVQGKTYSAKKNITNVKPGMPLEEGDEFMVKYLPNNPNLHKVDFTRPSQDQIDIYKMRVIDRLLAIHQDYTIDYSTCLANSVLESNGLNGLADLYFQDVSIYKNTRHNKDTYQQLMKSTQFKTNLSKNCN